MDNRDNQNNQNLENNNQQFNNQNLENNQQVNNQNNVQQQSYDQNNEEFEDFDNEKYFEENQDFEDEEQNAQNPKQNKNYGKLFLTVFAAFVLGATSVFGAQAVKRGTGSALKSSVTATKEDKDNQQLTVNAISKAKDAVVSVVTYQTNSNNLDSILGGNSKNKSNSNSNKNNSNSSDSGDLKTASTGSGVIYKKNW